MTSIEADFALMRIVNTCAKYMQVQVIEFVRFKIVLLHIMCIADAAKQLKMGSVCMAGQPHKSNSA